MLVDNVSVLMYHALLDANGECADADRHYAVTRPTLNRHLALMREAQREPSSLAKLLGDGSRANRVVLTFDDGHISNIDAARDIASQNGSADFFVNPDRVGKPNYLSWSALREMAEMGMSIQSHGQTHRYFNEMTDAEASDELRKSKEEIEQKVGKAVTVFAPPGGRLTPRVAAIAERLGYEAICSSRVGLWRKGTSSWNIPRFAVLLGTGDEQLRRWITQDKIELAKLLARQHVLDTMKRLLGNRGYERFRATALGGTSGSESST
jgi:peptidoglycan/xylan/chitin deacetylase (PgdA/CDA1 family)